MKENIEVFDFILTPDEIAAIGKLDKGESLFFFHNDPEMVKWLIDYTKQM